MEASSAAVCTATDIFLHFFSYFFAFEKYDNNFQSSMGAKTSHIFLTRFRDLLLKRSFRSEQHAFFLRCTISSDFLRFSAFRIFHFAVIFWRSRSFWVRRQPGRMISRCLYLCTRYVRVIIMVPPIIRDNRRRLLRGEEIHKPGFSLKDHFNITQGPHFGGVGLFFSSEPI
jgi:hypothetical protein